MVRSKVKSGKWIIIIAVGIFLTICGLTACGEVTADRVLKETRPVDYKSMTLGEILEAAIGCSEEISGEIADIIQTGGISEITEVKRYGYSTEERIGSWAIDTDQSELLLEFGKTESDFSLVLFQWPEFSMTGNEEQKIYFVDSPGFQLFPPESEGLSLVVNDGRATRQIVIQNKDFLLPWTVCRQGERMYYLNKIKLYVFNSKNELTDIERSFVVSVDPTGKTSLKIGGREVPVTDQIKSFGNGAEKSTIQLPNAGVTE